MKLVLVRHLATAWNREGRLQGRRDIPLDPLDDNARKVVAARAAEAATHGPFDLVSCSTLQRTRQTAEWFGYSSPRADSLVDELDFGAWEGVSREEFMKVHGEAWLYAPETLTFGESIADLGARVTAFIEQNLAARAVLLFGHGAWIRAARALHETGRLTTMNQRAIENSELIALEFESDWLHFRSK